jgi:hypothetical protein
MKTFSYLMLDQDEIRRGSVKSVVIEYVRRIIASSHLFPALQLYKYIHYPFDLERLSGLVNKALSHQYRCFETFRQSRTRSDRGGG